MGSANNSRTGIFLSAVLLAAAGVFFALSAFAGQPGVSSASFLKFAPSPRGTGMGEAYSSVSRDAYAAWWNPAGLASVETPEICATYNASFEDVSHQYVAFAYPLSYGSTLGFNVTRMSVAPFQGYDAAGWETKRVDSADTAFGAAYARTLLKDEIERPVFNIGANLKGISERLDNASANTLALDLGAVYYLRPAKYWMSKTPAQEFAFGLAVRNLGPGLKFDRLSFPLPLSSTLGASWTSHPWGAHTLTVALDQTISNDEKYIASLGAEYFMFQLLSFRAGFKSGQALGSGVRAGVGFRLSFMDLDYSMSPFGELGSMHKLGVSMRFGAPKARQPLAGGTARVEKARLMAPKEKIEQLANYANDYLELAKKNLKAREYADAVDNMNKAFNLNPKLKAGPWGDRYKRLSELGAKLRLRETPGRAQALRKDTEQARAGAGAIDAYVEGRELKAFLLAHAALGADLRGDALFEELLNTLAVLTGDKVRQGEILPMTALVKEKLKKSATAFYAQKIDAAARECEEVTLLDEQNPLGWTRLGSAYYMLGDKEKARSAYARALELNPGDNVTRQFMETQGWK
ncbi:MAG: PorV/PorQ family protein [Elusimicrobia bacterium]|nr:PorV/PorQ family protein [Elusimicrobiota bacterium]